MAFAFAPFLSFRMFEHSCRGRMNNVVQRLCAAFLRAQMSKSVAALFVHAHYAGKITGLNIGLESLLLLSVNEPFFWVKR